MSINKAFTLFILLMFCSVAVLPQQFGPKIVKNFDQKLVKGRTMLILPAEKIPVKNADMTVFKAFKTDIQKEREWKRMVDSAIKASCFDYFEFQVKDFFLDDMKKSKDKNVVLLYYTKDYYDNYYAEIATVEPKYEILACVPINGLWLTSFDDLKLMFNMLQYQLAVNSGYYGNEAKPLYRGHKNKYEADLRQFSEKLRNKVFLFAKYEKDVKGFAKKNDKMNTYLKMNWKLTAYEMASQKDIEQRVKAGFDGFYMKPIYIYTSNPKITYNYNLFLNGRSGNVLFIHQTNGLIPPAAFKYVQERMEEWLVANMDPKQQKEFQDSKSQIRSPSPQKTTPQPVKQDKSKTQPQPVKQDKSKQQPEPVKPGKVK